MEKQNFVFIACSLDGYIADKNGGIDWLNSVPNPENKDLGFTGFIERVNAILMGRNTFEKVCSFDIEWPYPVPVFVLSNTLKEIPVKYRKFAELVHGSVYEVSEYIHSRGHTKIYIDGGKTIQSFLEADLIDEIIISTIPVLLGNGFPLFGKLDKMQDYKLSWSKTYLDAIVQTSWIRNKD